MYHLVGSWRRVRPTIMFDIKDIVTGVPLINIT